MLKVARTEPPIICLSGVGERCLLLWTKIEVLILAGRNPSSVSCRAMHDRVLLSSGDNLQLPPSHQILSEISEINFRKTLVDEGRKIARDGRTIRKLSSTS